MALTFDQRLFPAHPERLAPKKRRGLTRYFRQLPLRSVCRVDPKGWWNLWHHHVDWPGVGNLGWNARKPHLRALASCFEQLLASRSSFPPTMQAWISLDLHDSAQDALFLHSPNPYNTPFPWKPSGLSWETLDGTRHAPLLPRCTLRAAMQQWTDEEEKRAQLLLYAPDFGVPLE